MKGPAGSAVLVVAILGSVLGAPTADAMPFYSRSVASGYGDYPGYAQVAVGESREGDGITHASAATHSSYYWAWGGGRANADPMGGVLKAEAWGGYRASEPITRPFWNNTTYTPATVGGGGATAYTRSVWQVTSDTLAPGTPVDLSLSLSLSGSVTKDWNDDGHASARIQTWLNHPEDLAFGGDPLDDSAYNPITTWYEDMGVAPNLQLELSNFSGPASIDRTISSDDPGPIFHPPLPPVSVGDILVLETYLQAYVEMVNDGTCVVGADGSCLGNVRADFYNTGITSLSVRTAGVTLTPYGSAVVPVPPAVWLFGSGLLGLVGVARRKRGA